MQFKLIATTLAAFSVGRAIAGPLPVPAQDSSLIAREAAPAADPAPAAEPAPIAQTIQVAQLSQIQQSARQWSEGQIGHVPTQFQVQQARTWWPAEVWTYNYWGINDWNNGWNANTWYLYYLYLYYYEYAWQWNAWWPVNNWDDWSYCPPGGWC